MARSHGKVLVDIWIDEDWLDRTPLEQWLYLLLLSQPKMNLVGCIDYEPHRWAKLAAHTTTEDVETAVDGLEGAGFVCIDRDTRELLVRSMTRHDGLRTNNPKILKGLWGQWRQIASRMLRKMAVDNMPDALFEDEEQVPPAALEMRRSERMDWRSNTQPIAQSADRSFRLPPSTTRHPTSADAQSDGQWDALNRLPAPAGIFDELRAAKRGA